MGRLSSNRRTGLSSSTSVDGGATAGREDLMGLLAAMEDTGAHAGATGAHAGTTGHTAGAAGDKSCTSSAAGAGGDRCLETGISSRAEHGNSPAKAVHAATEPLRPSTGDYNVGLTTHKEVNNNTVFIIKFSNKILVLHIDVVSCRS